jgi:NCAIR mutase (PurE)-related protein
MHPDKIRETLESVRSGALSPEDAYERLRTLPYEDIGFAKIDHHRALRRGFPEVIFCQGKSPEQVADIAERIAAHGAVVLATRAAPPAFAAVRERVAGARYDELARVITVNAPEPPRTDPAPVLIVSAGTADLPVAEEAALTAEASGCPVGRVYDVGVAGLHRLLGHREALAAAEAIVVVAGMEGALASVVGGLVECPVIAVPTSVGYGASFGGLAALLSMLNSCASGVVVVNIDNGFGAGRFAALLYRRSRRDRAATNE